MYYIVRKENMVFNQNAEKINLKIQDKTQIELDMRYNQGYTSDMKTAISIPDKIFQSADSLAKRLGLSRSQLYSTAISEYLSKYQNEQVTERLNVIYSEEDSTLSPNIIFLQTKSLDHEEW